LCLGGYLLFPRLRRLDRMTEAQCEERRDDEGPARA